MKGPFGKTLVKWKEPKEFRQIVHARPWTGKRVLIQGGKGLALAAVFMVMWVVAKQNPAKHPPPFAAAFPASVVAGLLLGFGEPWFGQMMPSQVNVGPKGVLWSQYRTLRLTAAGEVAACEIIRSRHGEQEHKVLRITTVTGDCRIFGIPEDISIGAVMDALVESGLQPRDSSSRPAVPFEKAKTC